MKEVFASISELKGRIDKKSPILLLDFDGVLSAIAPTPDEATISDGNKGLIDKCSSHFPVVIITGRSLKDIKGKVGLKKILYVASHGLEWEENDKCRTKSISHTVINSINLAKEKIKPLINLYPGAVFEDKPFTISTHYRLMSPKLVGAFKKEMNFLLEPIIKENKLRLDHNLMTFELRPEVNWDKGDSVLWAESYLNKKIGKIHMPIYIGDGLTDEDAFTAMKGNGITIRVGKSEKSAANYYLKSQKQVSKFLSWLVENH